MLSFLWYCGVSAAALTLIGCLGAAEARAETGFKLLLGGDAYFVGGAVDQKLDAGQRSVEFRNRIRLKIAPTATADNGLQYGARLILMAANADRTVSDDGAYMFLKGSFGQISAGVQGGPSDDSGVIAPSDSRISVVDGTFAAFLGNTGTNLPSMTINQKALTSGDAGTRLIYASPRFSGLQAVVSYQPQTGSYHTDIDRSKTLAPADSTHTGGYSDVYEGGVNYDGRLGDVTIKGAAYILGGQARDSAAGASFERLTSYHLGLSAAYGGLKVGGSYSWGGESGYIRTASNQAATDRSGQDVWTVGAQYTLAAYMLGVGYMHSRDAGDLTVRGDRNFDLIATGIRYVAAPGLAFGAEYNHFRLSSDLESQNDRGNMVLIRTSLDF